MLFAITLGSILAEILVVAAIILVLFFVLRIGRFLLRVLFGLIANSILGLIAVFVVNALFGMGITLTTPIFIAIAVFGLPAVGTLIILKVAGIALV